MSPSDQNDAIVVFTARSPARIIREGGSQAWVLNPVRAKLCRWLICTQNRHNPDHEFSDATEPHGTGFLLGRISGLRKSEEGDGHRWQIVISEFARIQLPDAWDHGRNPVRYTSLRKLGIDPDGMTFERIPPVHTAGNPPNAPSQAQSSPAAMLAEAKRTLAAAFGVKPEAVEITIRG
jgi:hypothetical protein